MMAAFALSLALVQEPVSHEQAMICTGLFANMIQPFREAQQREPTERRRQGIQAAIDMNRLADGDRRAAAEREGLSISESDQRLAGWIAANPHTDETLHRHLDGCIALYFDRR